MKTVKSIIILFFLFCSSVTYTFPLEYPSPQLSNIIWAIGSADKSSSEFALAPDGFKDFIGRDFGFEDKFYLIGYSKEKHDFPYVLPGPVDTWGGTWNTSGWRTNQVNILFGIRKIPKNVKCNLVIELSDYAKKFLPLVKISINGQVEKTQLSAAGFDVSAQPHPGYNEPYVDSVSLLGDRSDATPKMISIPIKMGILKEGGNFISIEVLEGSWIMFDQIRLEGDHMKLVEPKQFFIRSVHPADYELDFDGNRVQPLLVDIEHIKGLPRLSVKLDDEIVFSQLIEKGRYELEVPMPAVPKQTRSTYAIFLNGNLMEEGTVIRSNQQKQTRADYVDTRIGTGHSRWMIAPGPWMPFSMVKMSPDNQNSGWQAGYQPSYESIGTFSHIHEWTMGGLGIFATNGKLKTHIGDELKLESGYRSKIDKKSEEAPIGYYKVLLKDYDIKAELTATSRCSFTKFTYPKDRDSSRILIDLHIPTEQRYQVKEVYLYKQTANRVVGFCHQYSPGVWSHDAEQDYTVHFVIEFDSPIKKMGYWVNKRIRYGDTVNVKDPNEVGAFVEFDTRTDQTVQVRSGISLVSIFNAGLNLEKEVRQPFGWDFEAVRSNQVVAWNEIFDRIKIHSANRLEKVRFYNAMYRSICSRNIWSDINGEWRGTDGKIQKSKSKEDVVLGCDAFWNTFWNLNQLWNLITPEWSSQWVKSQLALYDAYGWLAKGPAGMNYIPVMVAEHEIPQMVSAYQMGIRDFDVNKVLEAAVKMQTTPAQKVFSGFAGNRDLTEYIKHTYVPSDKGRFSNTMEYSYDDWCVGQLAKSLGNKDLFEIFDDRGGWWRNAIDENGYCHMKLSNGQWTPDFDPFLSGANKEYVEGNAWQLTFFVPQDVPGLIKLVGQKEFVERLDWGFRESAPWRYNGMNDQYWDYPVAQGNQQSMHFAFLFNWAGKPWLTQKWSRSVMDRYYGYGINNAYLGDEDQGQMSAWFVMASLGLFQTDGGCSSSPIYEIGSPLFKKVEIDLGQKYGRGKKFTIIVHNASRLNKYIQSATLNGKPLSSFKIAANEVLKGGSLILEMGAVPNKSWGNSE